jgi:hypothetical protein
MNFLRLLTTAALGLLAAFAHAANVGELPSPRHPPRASPSIWIVPNSMAPYLPAVEAEVRKQFP